MCLFLIPSTLVNGDLEIKDFRHVTCYDEIIPVQVSVEDTNIM